MGRSLSATAAALILAASLAAGVVQPAPAQSAGWRTLRRDRVILHYSLFLPDTEIELLFGICKKARKKSLAYFGAGAPDRLEIRAYADVPAWFEEGLAAQVSQEFAGLVTGHEGDYVWRGSLANLQSDLTQAEDPDRAQSAYHAVYVMVHALEADFGRDKMLLLIRKLNTDSDFDSDFEARFKVSPDKYLKSLQKKYPLSKKQKK